MKINKNIFIKIILKYFYIKTKIHQKIYRDGGFPFKDYNTLSEYIKKYNLKNGLEVGTAVGLTAFSSTVFNNNFKLETIEKHKRNLDFAKNNVKSFDKILNTNTFSQINFVEGKMFEVLETAEYINKKYDYIFLDAYVSRYNEVNFLNKYLGVGGIFIVSNIREDIEKSVLALNFLKDANNFEFLEMRDDTIFVRKKKGENG